MYHIFCAVDDVGGDTFPFPEKSLFWVWDKDWFARYTMWWKYFGNIQGSSWKFLGHFICHFGWQYHSNHSNSFISNEWSQNLQQIWVLLQSVKGRLSVHDQLFCRHQHRGSLHGVTRKLDLDQKTNVIKLIFQSGLVTFYTNLQ